MNAAGWQTFCQGSLRCSRCPHVSRRAGSGTGWSLWRVGGCVGTPGMDLPVINIMQGPFSWYIYDLHVGATRSINPERRTTKTRGAFISLFSIFSAVFFYKLTAVTLSYALPEWNDLRQQHITHTQLSLVGLWDRSAPPSLRLQRSSLKKSAF